MKELLTDDLKNARLTMIMGTAEFGQEVAVPLKEAIRRTRGVTLVNSLPVGRGAETVGLRFDQRRGRGSVSFPGEVLFVGFNPPTYNWREMGQGMDMVARKVADYEIEVEQPGVIDTAVFCLGSIKFTEKGQVPVIEDRTSKFSTDNPSLIDLLKVIGIKVGSVAEWQQQYVPERVTYAVFYPSRLLAAVVCDLGSLLRIIPGEEEYHSMLGKAGFGAMTLMDINDLQSLGEFATTPRRELRIVQRILSGHHPDYTIPKNLVA